MNPLPKKAPFFIVSLLIGGIIIFGLNNLFPLPVETVLALVGLLVLFGGLLAAFMGSIWAVCSLVMPKLRRESGILAPLATLFMGILAWTGVVTFVYFLGSPIVKESSRPLTLTESRAVLPTKLPNSAKDIYYAQSAGFLGGRFIAYRFSAPLDDLVKHAQSEFENHWDKLKPKKTNIQRAHVDSAYIASLKDAYGVSLAWFDLPKLSNGILFSAPASDSPSIWIDKDRKILYYLWTD